MTNMKMHSNELDINEFLVNKLLREQFLQWVNLSISRVKSVGTDNAIYRLGIDKCIRLPRLPEVAKDVEKEQLWLPLFAQKLPLAIPILIGKGDPSENYPYQWSIFSWIEGDSAANESISNQNQAAIKLAHFITELQKSDTTNAPLSRRGMPLITQDDEERQAIKSLGNSIDIKAVTALWDETLKVSNWDRQNVWTHGDLLPSNLLIKNGELCAVIDFGLMGVGDPACDLIPAWSLFSSSARLVFRSTLNVDDATWLRGRGWALSIAVRCGKKHLNNMYWS